MGVARVIAVVVAMLAMVVPGGPAPATPPHAAGSTARAASTDGPYTRDQLYARGHSARGGYVIGASGGWLVSGDGNVVFHRPPRSVPVDVAYEMCGDMVVTATTPEYQNPQRVDWRNVATGRTGTLPTDDFVNLVGPAPTGIIYAEPLPTTSVIWLRTTDGVRHRLAEVPGFVDGSTARCDTSGVAIITRASPSPRAGDTDRLVWVRFTGGHTTIATALVSSGLGLVDVAGTRVLWSLGTSPTTPVVLERTDVGVGTRTVVTVPKGTWFDGAGTAAAETLYTTGSSPGTTTRVGSDGYPTVLDGETDAETTWWASGGTTAGADRSGVVRVGAGSLVRTWVPPFVLSVGRIHGRDRYETAAGLWWPESSTVYVAAGTSYADALSGVPAAVADGAPLLLTAPTTLPDAVRGFLDRTSPSEVVLLGGPGAVSASVERALRAYAPTVRRLQGADRYATSVAVSRDLVPNGAGGTVVLASGTTFADALGAGPAAAHWGGPVLLTDPTRLRADTAAELDRIAPARVVVAGGTGAVSAAVEAAVRAHAGSVTRIAGSDRYATAARLSAAAFPAGVSQAVVASGQDFPDGLAGGALVGQVDGPVLLTTRRSAPAATRGELARLRPHQALVLGGPAVVSEGAVQDLAGVYWW